MEVDVRGAGIRVIFALIVFTALIAVLLTYQKTRPATSAPVKAVDVNPDAQWRKKLDDYAKNKAARVKKTGQTNPDSLNVPKAHDWDVYKSKSNFTDGVDVSLDVSSEETINCGWNYPGGKIRLILRCLENTTSMILETGCYMTSSEYDDYGDVDYRLDSEPMHTISMLPSRNNRSLGLWYGTQSIPMIKRMFGKKNMLMRFTAYSQNRSEVTFHIEGLEKQIAPLRKSCHW